MKIDIPESVVEAAADAFEAWSDTNKLSMYSSSLDWQHESARVIIAAALAEMLEPVGIVCMNGRRYGHGLFGDIEVQYPTLQTGGPSIGRQLYTLKGQ